jgi:hypothetical protein
LTVKQGSTQDKTSSHSTIKQSSITKHLTYEESSAIDFDSLPLTSQSQSKKDKSIFNDPSLSNNMPNLPPKSMADLLNKSNDFLINYNNLTTTPMLAYWYGLCKFVLIAPTRSNSFIDNETRSCVILSAATTAVNNTGWYYLKFYNLIFKFRYLSYDFKKLDSIIRSNSSTSKRNVYGNL